MKLENIPVQSRLGLGKQTFISGGVGEEKKFQFLHRVSFIYWNKYRFPERKKICHTVDVIFFFSFHDGIRLEKIDLKIFYANEFKCAYVLCLESFFHARKKNKL